MPNFVLSVSNDEIHIAFEDGRDAYHHGQPSLANPYGGDPKTNPEYNPTLFGAWNNGWLAAKFSEQLEMER